MRQLIGLSGVMEQHPVHVADVHALAAKPQEEVEREVSQTTQIQVLSLARSVQAAAGGCRPLMASYWTA